VVGEVGIGKSRLVYEFTQCLMQQGGRYIEGSCFTYGEGISYLPFLAIVKGLCGLTGTETETAASAQLRQHLHTLGLDVPAVVPYLQHLLTLPVEDHIVPTLSPELVRQRTLEALKMLLLAEVRDRPVVLILEDVHWIDHASEEVLTALVEAMGGSPLLLVLVYRPEYGSAWSNTAAHTQITLPRLPHASSAAVVHAILAKPYAAGVRLERLTPAQSQAMMQDLVGATALPAEAEQFIITKADGNPLFVEELTHALVESGVLVREPEGYRLRAAPTALQLPATIQGVLLARLDRLPAALKTVLQAASVIGRVLSYAVLALVVGPGMALDEALLQLEEAEFLHPRSLTPQHELSFKHVLTQEAVYQTLLQPQREQYHARVAQAIETLSAERLEEVYEVLAHHYVRSGNKDKALEYLALANQKAAKVNAMTEAKQYFESAMALLDTLPDTEEYQRRRLELLVSQLAPMLLLMQFQEYYDLLLSYEATAIRLGHAGLLGALYGRMGICEWWFGRLDQAIGTLTKAAALCDAAGNAEDAAQAYVILQWSHLYKGDYDRVLALKNQALQALEQRFDLRYYVWSLSAVSWAYTCLGRWQKGTGHYASGKNMLTGAGCPWRRGSSV
jgi:predicted ATPase